MSDVPAASTTPVASATINTLILAQLRPEDLTIAMNVKQEFVTVTTDKAKLVLRDFKDAIEAKNGILATAGTLVAVVTTLITADFKNILGLSNEQWWTLYLFVAIGCLGWIVWSVIVAFQRRQMREIKTVIEHLKGNT